MTHNAKKYGLLIIAAVLLVALAFAGAASADETAGTWAELKSKVETHTTTDPLTIVVTENLVSTETVNKDGIAVNGTVIIKPSPDKDITIDGDKVHGRLFKVLVGGNLTLEGNGIRTLTLTEGVASSGNKGGAIFVTGGKCTLNDGVVITDCEASSGGGIGVTGKSGSFTMNGGSITGCKATGNHGCGGGMWISGGTFTMNGGSITGCTANVGVGASGGGVYANDDTSLTMTGGSISECTANNNGGGVYIMTGPTKPSYFYVRGDAKITGNTKDGNPNNVWLYNGIILHLSGDFIGQIGIQSPASNAFGVTDAATNKGAQNFILDSTISSEAPTVGTIDGSNNLVWSANGHYVPFHLSDGSTETTWKQSAAENGPVTDPSASLSKEGQTLDGWYSDAGYQNKWNFAAQTTADTNLYARWAQPPATTYNVTIALGIQHGDVKVSQKSATPGTTIIVTPIPDDGYAFKELIVKDKSGNPVKPATETTFIMPTSDVIVSAVFVEEPEPVVSKNRGHSASIPKDYTPSSSVPPMVQETAKPTTTPTAAVPTVMPTTKPTTQATTSKSPAPLAGLIAGLGAAALLIRMRR